MPQSEAPVQLTNVPPTPSCNPDALFGNVRECRDLWNAYNQAVSQRQKEEGQLYVARQKQLATAPLQQQIADQQSQIKQLHDQMQTDATAALQAKAAAHTQGMEYGAGIGVAGSLVLFAVIFGIKLTMSNFTVTKKPQAQSTAAGK